MQKFTGTEIKILDYLEKRLDENQIAEELKISKHTVKAHIRSIRRKAGSNKQAQAGRHQLNRPFIPMHDYSVMKSSPHQSKSGETQVCHAQEEVVEDHSYTLVTAKEVQQKIDISLEYYEKVTINYQIKISK